MAAVVSDQEFAQIVAETKALVLSAISKSLDFEFADYLDDVVQETYLRAYKGLTNGSFRGDSKMETWLFSIARHEALRMNEKQIRLKKKQIKVESFYEEPFYDHTEVLLNKDLVTQYLQQLPANYAVVLQLVGEGFSEKEIAEQLDLKVGTVKSRKSRGRRLIKSYLKEENNEK